MPDPNVVYIGQEPDPACSCGHERIHHTPNDGRQVCTDITCPCLNYEPWTNWVRRIVTDHYTNAELMASVKAEDDALDATFIDLLQRWYQDSPDADCFEIGVNEKIGTVRLRLARRDTKAAVDVSAYTQALLEAGVSPEVIQQAQEKATVPGKEGKPFPRFDRVKDDRDRDRPTGELRLVK